jgi:phosphotransferase system HPr (HPr) family protein
VTDRTPNSPDPFERGDERRPGARRQLPADSPTLEIAAPVDVTLHARPAALIVGIVHRHGGPVEVEVGGRTYDAASILELMLAAGSNRLSPTFRFRGAAKVLDHIRLLFEHGLGQRGLEELPAELSYLRGT